MTTAIALRDNAQRLDLFHGDALDRATALAERLANSGLMPDSLKRKPDDVLVIIMSGYELGLSPMASIRGIHVIKGKPVVSADAMVALVQSSSQCGYFRLVASTDELAEYETQRAGHPKPVRMIYTMQQAHKAGLTTKDNWKNHPAAMLRARCAAALARATYPELMLGIYVDDERAELEVDVIDEEIDIRAFKERIEKARSADELEMIAASIRGLPESDRNALRGAFSLRSKELGGKKESIKERGRKARASKKEEKAEAPTEQVDAQVDDDGSAPGWLQPEADLEADIPV